MKHLARFDCRDSGKLLRVDRPIKGDLVPSDMDDNYAEWQRFDIMLVLESPIGRANTSHSIIPTNTCI